MMAAGATLDFRRLWVAATPYARFADEAQDLRGLWEGVYRRAPLPSARSTPRDQHPEVMDRYLTGGTRSIPIIIALSAAFEEIGHWGPRPAELQAWAKANKGGMEKKEFYAEMRRWHVRDGGESTLREVLALL